MGKHMRCAMCNTLIRLKDPFDKRITVKKDDISFMVLVCTQWWNKDVLCRKCITKILKDGKPYSNMTILRDNKMVPQTQHKYDLEEKDNV